MATNLTSATPSIDAMISATQANGSYRRAYNSYLSSTSTAANATSGRISARRFPQAITIPSMGTGVAGVVMTTINMSNEDASTICLCALEKSLGTLTVSGNTFSSGSSMPTKTIMGTSVTTASVATFAVVTTALTATTPVLTITYTDQDGNTGNTATLTLPTNPNLNTAFLINPHLASGDTGIRAVTNISISTGTAGVIEIFGCLPLAYDINGSTQSCVTVNDLLQGMNAPILCEANDVISFYRLGSTGGVSFSALLIGAVETT